MLISSEELHAHLHDRDWIVFDCRHDLFAEEKGAQLYRDGHIPGAYFAPVDTALAGGKTGQNGRHPLPKPEQFAEFLAGKGVNASTQIVAYDDVGGQYAARLWWMARWIGLTKVGVLDGGLPKWVANGYELSKEVPQPRSGGSIEVRVDPALLVTAEDVVRGMNTEKLLVVDARAPERFRGETEPIDPVAGHIPMAQNRFFKSNLNPDLTLRSKSELKKEFEALLAGHKPSEVVHQCGSGITACANLLAMEYAGLTGSKLYPGSWSEWIADPARPVARG
jgi:thiosulfate/3-mercaptopyruvate sulfurtransferase